jgi:quinol monooxygenase YgiN
MNLTRRSLLAGTGGALWTLAAGRARSQTPRSTSTRSPSMVVEYVRYEIPEARRETFLAAYRSAAQELRGSPHCLRYEVSQGVEEPSHFVVRIEWDSVEGHEKGFRTGPSFAGFFQKVRPFFDDIREMKHYRVSDVVSG